MVVCGPSLVGRMVHDPGTAYLGSNLEAKPIPGRLFRFLQHWKRLDVESDLATHQRLQGHPEGQGPPVGLELVWQKLENIKVTLEARTVALAARTHLSTS